MADARSEIVRKSVHDWYTGTCYNRMEKRGKIILINHRKHQDDLCGRLLAQQAAGGDRWEVVELKAVSSDGGALWREKFSAEGLERIKRNISAADWAALYQQEPTAETGTYFKDEWLRPYVDGPPRFLNVYPICAQSCWPFAKVSDHVATLIGARAGAEVIPMRG